jgi:6-phosphogluconolactonase
MPAFDLILLGLGEDGHTASIFPDRPDLFHSEKICEVSVNPGSFQKRITVTGKVINNAKNIRFLVTGANKAAIIKKIINKEDGSANLPAASVFPLHGKMEWLLDTEAASLL